MSETMNWDEIRSEESLLRPGKMFEAPSGAPLAKGGYAPQGYDAADGMDAPLLRDDPYTELPMSDASAVLWSHCHWSPRVAQHAAAPQLLAATAMCAIFMVGELVGGYLAGSLAIMCDAAHLLSDCAGFLLALSALFLARRPPQPRMTYGYRRAEVLGALMSILLIWLVTGIFVYLAILRLWEGSYDIQVDAMMLVSGVGMVVNVLMALILHGACHSISHIHSHGGSSSHSHSHSHPAAAGNGVAEQRAGGRKNGYRNLAMEPLEALPANGSTAFKDNITTTGFEDVELLQAGAAPSSPPSMTEQSINVRAAAIHVLGDLIQSAGVFLAAVIINIYPSAKIVDPLCTFVFSIIVMCTTIRILREAITVLMEGTPPQVRYESVLAALRGLSGVRAVHSLHIWAITNHHNVLTVHLAIDQYTDSDSTLKQALHIIRTKFKIDLATVQVERYHEEAMTSCGQCAANTDT